MSGALTRRSALALGGGGIALAAYPALAAAPPSVIAVTAGGRSYAKALTAIRRYAEDELDATGLPGMTLALVDADGFSATISVGWADVDKHVPVTPRHWFEIGSISKSLTALTVHRLAERGMIDLDAPVSRYLADAPLPRAPITISQLLDHTSGLPHDAPVFPRTPDGRLWTGFAPGKRFSYSNIGYTLLGLTIARVTGRPHPDVILNEVLRPLGMTDATARIVSADRARYATGYVPLLDDRAALTRAPLVAGIWTEDDMAAGAVSASAQAMTGYLRYVLGLGMGRGGALLSDATASRIMANPVAAPDFGPEARYGGGFAHVPVDGRQVLHHTGGMVLFSSSFHADPQAGVACFASVNGALGSYRPRKTTAFAIQALAAARAGAPLPVPPDPLAFRAVTQPDGFVGRWIAADGAAIEIRKTGATISVAADGATGRIEQTDKDAIATDHPALSLHLIRIERKADKIERLWWGGTVFGRGVPAREVKPSPRLATFEGRYVSHDPWSGSATVVVAGDTLWIEGFGQIVERDGGYWSRADDPGGVDRIWFDAPLGARTSRLSFCGNDLIRLG